MLYDSQSYVSPSKINLFLHVLHRRNDGYHELQTLFQLLNYGDELTFKPNNSGIFEFHQTTESQAHALPASQNLIVEAAQLIQKTTKRKNIGAKIDLYKRIPIGAGLGGGSSNAATTLKVLNKLWGCNLSDQELTTLALKLGADVPFFLKGESAWGEGIGEKLKPIKLKKAWFAIITPNCSVSTARIFSHENLTRNTQAIKMADFLAGSTENTKNDCEPVVRKLYPQVDEAFRWLESHAEPRMTGTGSSVFAKFSSEEQAKALLTRLPDNMRGFVAEGINTL